MVLILLLLVGAIAFLAVRGCRAGAAVAPAQGPVRISCVGDSITYGFGLADREHECWTFLLEGRLPEGSSVGNYGVSGSCAMSCGYYPWTRTAQSHVFWEAEEDVVILMLGTNDVADSAWDAGAFEQSFEELVDRILAKPGHPRLPSRTAIPSGSTTACTPTRRATRPSKRPSRRPSASDAQTHRDSNLFPCSIVENCYRNWHSTTACGRFPPVRAVIST